MKYRNTQEYEFINKNKRDLIKEHLLECYQKICNGKNDSNIDVLIRHHRKVITSMALNGKNKNKYKTIQYLEHYKNTKNKAVALNILTNTIYRM